MPDSSPGAPSAAAHGRDVTIRRARTSDVPEIKRLVDTYAGKILLEKDLGTLYLVLRTKSVLILACLSADRILIT